MGHFALLRRKKHAETPEKSTKTGFSLFAQSLGVDTALIPVFTSARKKEKPFSLRINTHFPANWTPPSSPDSSKTSTDEPNSGKVIKTLELPLSPQKSGTGPAPSSTPPNSPISNSVPRRKSSLTSLFFMTPRQRKLQEIRLGKQPAVVSDSELRLSISSDEIPTEIEDPSSSTTYSRRQRVKES
jgi:hypothetical protein